MFNMTKEEIQERLRRDPFFLYRLEHSEEETEKFKKEVDKSIKDFNQFVEILKSPKGKTVYAIIENEDRDHYEIYTLQRIKKIFAEEYDAYTFIDSQQPPTGVYYEVVPMVVE